MTSSDDTALPSTAISDVAQMVGHSYEGVAAGPARVTDTWADIMGQNYARNAIECAAWAIASAKLDVPLTRLWGGVRDAVDVGESFPICDTPEELLAEVGARLEEGFGRVKLKIAPGWDVGAVRAVQESFPGVPVSVDANCGYSLDSGPWPELDDLDQAKALDPSGDIKFVPVSLILGKGASRLGFQYPADLIDFFARRRVGVEKREPRNRNLMLPIDTKLV